MIVPSLRRPADSWRFLVSLLRAVTQPHVDPSVCDARVERLVADSYIVRALTATVDACGRAAGDSMAVDAWRRTVSRLVPDSIAERVRAVGCVTVAAAATTLILRPAGTGTEPLTWIVPGVAAAIGMTCIASARPIARAIAGYRS